MAKYIPVGEPTNESERKGIRMLRDVLPDHYVIIGNFDLQLPRRINTLEYDAVVVGEWSIYAVEIRGWGGPIEGDIRRWELEWGRVENPFIRIERKAKALRDLLVRNVDGFPDEIFCESVVFLTREDADVRVNDPRNRRLIRTGQLWEYFVEGDGLYDRGPGPMLDAELRQGIVDTIVPLASPASGLPSVPGYEIEGQLDRPDAPYREYVGRHKLLSSRDKVRIKAYSLDPLLTQSRRQDEFSRAVRDMEALGALDDNVYVARAYEMIQDREDDLVFYLVSEWVGPRTLRVFVDAGGGGSPVGKPDCARYAKHLLQAVSFMHQREIVHRNLHPGVIYLTDSRSSVPLKIADFDYARVAHLHSIAGEVDDLGTDGYIAPEMWMGQDYDHRIDLFSVGVILFELFSGERLYDDVASMLNHENHWPEQRDKISYEPALDVLDLLLSFEADARPEGLERGVALFGELAED